MGAVQKSKVAQAVMDLIEKEVPATARAYFNKLLADIAATGRSDLEDTFVRFPVDIETFIFDKGFLATPVEDIWPTLIPHLKELNSGQYIESVLTGPIGTGKTTVALYTQAYQLYLLSCYKNPQRSLGIKQTDEILFVLQNMNKQLSKEVDFARFQSMIEHSHYFTKVFKPDPEVTSELKFPHRIIVRPLSGQITAAIGQNVYGGILDEVNFMQIVMESKKVHGTGVSFDQAEGIYNTISTRRMSRFMELGRLPGVLCIVSSRNYPGQFTDKLEERAKKQKAETGKSTIYVYDVKHWDLQPHKYCGDKFPVFIGDMSNKPRIVGKDEIEKYGAKILMVPVEWREKFEQDINMALRDIGGVSTMARHPFIPNVEAIDKALSRDSIFSHDTVDFNVDELEVVDSKVQDESQPRFIHIDLAISGDSAGFAMGYVKRFPEMFRGDHVEQMPEIVLDAVLEIKAPKSGEIDFARIRTLIYNLTTLGYPIKWVSFDAFQSTDMQQILRQKGYISGLQSMDVDTIPYMLTKTAINDGRIIAPDHPKLRKELLSLEWVAVPKPKVDHPPTGSKDCADALAGVVFGLTMRREVWLAHGVSPANFGNVIQHLMAKAEAKDKKSADTAHLPIRE